MTFGIDEIILFHQENQMEHNSNHNPLENVDAARINLSKVEYLVFLRLILSAFVDVGHLVRA